jgi:DNA primase
MFPISDRQGRTVAFGGRSLSADEERKYVNSPESDLFKKGRNLFALDLALSEIRSGKIAVIAEGYMDALALHQAGVINAVAPLGTAFTDDQARLLKRWADKIILMLDADEAGRQAAVKAILTCRANGMECFVALPPGNGQKTPKDPAEILQKNGAGALQNAVECSILDFEYLLSRSRPLAEETGDKSKAAAFLFPYFMALDSEIKRDSYMTLAADELGIERRAIGDDYNRFTRPDNRFFSPVGESALEKVSKDDSPRMNGELYLLTAVFLHPSFYKELRSKLLIDNIEDRHARELFIILEEWYRNSGTADFSPANAAEESRKLFSALKNGGLKDFLMRQGAEGAFTNPGRIVSDGITRVKNRTLQRRRAEIVRDLRRPGIDSVRQADLLAEKLHIDSQLTLRTEA